VELSARNVLKGTVESVTEGMVDAEVIVKLPGGETIVSVITKGSAERLGLKKGQEVHAVIKASNVIIATD